MAGATAPPTTPTTSVSVDPLYTQALAQAKASLQPQVDEQAAEQAASDAAFKQRQVDAVGANGTGGVYGALAGLLKGIGPAVQGAYNTAAQNQELAGAGFSQGMQDALNGNTNNLNSMLAKLNVPAQLDSHAQQAGDVLYSLGGYNPGTTFAKQGAAFGAAADMLPADALLKGAEQYKALSASAQQADVGFQNKIAQIAAKLPGDAETNYTKLQSMALQDKKLAAQIANDKFNQAYKIKQLGLQVQKFNVDAQYKNAQLKLSAQKVALESQRIANTQYNADRNYQLHLANLGIAQKKLQMSIVAASFKMANGGYTQKDLKKINTQALGYAQQAFNGTLKYHTSTKNGVTTTSTVKGYGRLSYGDAMTQMLKKGWPVQSILGALNQVYGQPTPAQQAEIAQALGPLAPDALKQVIANQQATLGALAQPTGSPQAIEIKGYAFKTAAANFGWGADQQHYLDMLWTQESGWNPNAVNPKSGAAGIPQALGHGHVFDLGDYRSQVNWGLNYIKGRYGTPQAAWAHETQFGWY